MIEHSQSYPLQSETIGSLAKALSALQGSLENVTKDTQGHGYKYATLAECLKAIRPHLQPNGLSVTQTTLPGPMLITTLMHESGEWSRGYLPLHAQGGRMTNEMQALGSGITYARRYTLCAIFGLAQEDDDGVSSVSQPPYTKPTVVASKDPTPAQRLAKLCQASNIDPKAFAAKFKISSDNPESCYDALNNFEDYKNDFLRPQGA